MNKMFNYVKKNKAALAGSLAFFGATASQAAIDVSGAVTAITGSSTAVETVGVAVIGVCAVVLAIKLIKRVL